MLVSGLWFGRFESMEVFKLRQSLGCTAGVALGNKSYSATTCVYNSFFTNDPGGF